LHEEEEKMKKLQVLLFASISLLIASCSASDAQIATAIAQTQAAIPQDTPTIVPSPTHTHTPEPTITPEPTLTPSPTPDLRVFDIDPRNLLLSKDDLQKDGRYYLPNSRWISPHRNSEVISGWGAEEGREYLAKTGRIDGWIVAYARGTRTVVAPDEIYDNVVLYKTSEGAMLVITDYSSCKDPDSGFELVETDFSIGDAINVCIDKEMQPNGKNRVWYRIEFVYRNIFHGVTGWGWEDVVTPEFIEDVTVTLLEKLTTLPLSSEVSFKP
jgi:hypothetical protein